MPRRLAAHPASIAGLAGGLAGVLALVAYLALAPLDDPESQLTVAGTAVLDARGTVLSRDARAGLRIPVGIAEVAPLLVHATIAAEDRRFAIHPGVDPLAIARALASSPGQPSGASTITQQLARRLYLGSDDGPPLLRKLREAGIALQLDARYSKDELLELYLNDVYYGRGAYGIEAAARMYFGSSARELDLARASFLAGLPQRPSELAASDGSAGARQRYVLGRMVEDGIVSQGQADAAAAQPLGLIADHPAAIAPHFVALAHAELARVRPDLAGRDGLVIETTLDAGLQAEVERLIDRRLEAAAGRNLTNAALVALEPGSGRILAFVGGATDGDSAHGGEIDMALAPRQPGSALKPLLYAAALERGFTPATPLLDVPTTYATGHGPYAPLNFDRSFQGVVPLRVALGSSLNVPAVRTLDAIGMDAMLEISCRFGLRTLTASETYGLSLALGGGEVRLLDLAAAYAALAAEGRHADPIAVTRVRDGAGRVLYESPSIETRRVLSTQHAYLLADILSDADARIPGFGAVTPFDLPFAAAVKSGTSTGFRDNWTVGYTPEIAIGVWVGNADGSSMLDVSGVEGAGPIWRDAMMAAALARQMSWYARPADIVEVTVCARTGLLPGPDCPSPTLELFVRGTEPSGHERYYARAADGTLTVDLPADARAWARDAGLAVAIGDAGADDALRVVYPVPGTVLWIAPELGTPQVLLRASPAPGLERVAFLIDGERIGEATVAEPWVLWRLAPGAHVLEVQGRSPGGDLAIARSAFEVRR
jgi:penicillin-binding protein 1C